jgi:protein-S-isoprenylcysteine O-methyltransferase Ste14
VVLRWLGKSFSIFAEARRLVAEGPYRIVQHPLHLCEAAVSHYRCFRRLPCSSPFNVGVMINEEAILKVAFPEYRAYAANTSFLIPTRLSRFFTGSNPP